MKDKLITCQKCFKEAMRKSSAKYCFQCTKYVTQEHNDKSKKKLKEKRAEAREWKDSKKKGVRPDNFYGQKNNVIRLYKDEICDSRDTAATS